MKKILIIEDDLVVSTIYKKRLEQENYAVEIAADGEIGFDLINSFTPDVIILDLMLPKITGLDLLKKIRAQEKLKQLPVIVFSNTYLSNMVQEAWKAGATKCLSKANCTAKQVIEVVRELAPQTATATVATSAPAKVSGLPASAPIPFSPAPVEPPSENADNDFQAELRRSFLVSSAGSIAICRSQLQAAARSADEATRNSNLQTLYRSVHTLTSSAAVAGATQIAQMSDALEALLRELCDKPKNITASTLRSVALAIDFLGVLFERATANEQVLTPAQTKPNILVVDDEAISRRAVTYALEKAKLPSTNVESPEAALDMLSQNVYDLVFLDVDMPGMNGFELCTRLRGLHRNKNTPVVFVTSLTDFESRANSTMSGGNDLIAKPFLFMELAVKALVYVLRSRLPAVAK